MEICLAASLVRIDLARKSVVKELAAHTAASASRQQVGPVAPAPQEASEVLSAKLIPLVFLQLGPLTVFVPGQGQTTVGNNAVSFILELEAIIDVQVTVETETLPH